MAKTKRSILMLLACVFLFSVAALIFTACSTPSYTVTFLVQNDATGEWEQYATETSEEGVVTLPNNPSKTDYVFRNWYDNTDFTGDPFTGENVDGDMNVYAYFVPTEISVNVTKSQDDVDEDTVYVRDLDTLKEQYEAEALAANLTFDGWYTGADFDTLWTSSSDVDVVYGRFMAQIIYDNGFETYEPFTIQAGTTISEPTLEYIQKSYMDDEDIFYVDEEGKDIDFSQPITENTEITVLWKTPWLLFNENANGTYTCAGIDVNQIRKQENADEINALMESLPVISLPARVTVADDGGKKTEKTVESVHMTSSFGTQKLNSVQKIIVNEGIKWIYGIQNSSTVEEVVLPSTLKGLESALNKLTNLKSLTIPSGVEVIIASLFYQDVSSSINKTYSGYDFPIEIPASVENMALMPVENLTFAEGSPFYIEDRALYMKKDNDIVLINSFDVTDGELHVKDGVKGIQVGAFQFNKDVDYVYIPGTVSYMNANKKHTEYPYALSSYKSNASSTMSRGSYLDCSGFQYGEVRESQKNAGIMLYDNLGDDEILSFIFDTESYPETLPENAFCDGKTSWQASPSAFYVVFTKEVATGQEILVNVSARNTSVSTSTYFTITAKAGEDLTETVLLEKLGETELSKALKITSVTQLGKTYELPSQPYSNVYLNIEYVYTAPGFTFTVSDGEATVTGLDTANAIQLESGYYFVNITSTVSQNGKTYPVTAIAAEAFKGKPIETIVIASSVKEIGASAFENCEHLKAVNIEAGGLEKIGAHAFEDTGFTSITLPLSKVTEIGPYAFKSKKLQYFIASEGETVVNRLSVTATSIDMEKGKYYLFNGYSSSDGNAVCFIIKYTGSVVEKCATYSDRDNKTVDVTVHDIQIIAMAGGCQKSALTLGASMRAYSGDSFVFRYELMEGSIYYLSNSRMRSIVFGIVKKVHTNAFTDINEKFYQAEEGTYKGKVYRYEGSKAEYDIYDGWLTLEQITGIASKDYDFKAADAIFEDGWFNGFSVSDADYEEKMSFMSSANVTAYPALLFFQ